MDGLGHCLRQVGLAETFPLVHVISEDPDIVYPLPHFTVYLDPESMEASEGVMVACSIVGLGHCWRQLGLAESFPLVHVISGDPEMVYPSLHFTEYLDPELMEASAGVMVACSMVGLGHFLTQVGLVESFPLVHVISGDPKMVYPSLHFTEYLDPELMEASEGVMVACSMVGLGHCLTQVGLVESFPSVHVISGDPDMVYPSPHLTVYFDPELMEASDGVIVAWSIVGLLQTATHEGRPESVPEEQVTLLFPDRAYPVLQETV
jgi:hypothetical protein